MKKIRSKKIISLLMTALIALSTVSTAFAVQSSDEIIVLYTNDVHCAIDDYAVLAAYKARLEEEGKTVITVDAGDAIQGEYVGLETEGAAIVEIMNAVGYDYAVPGNHEFDYGMEAFLNLADNEAEFKYTSCNFEYLPGVRTMFEPYYIEDINGVQVAFLGMTTPESVTSSNPQYFKDKNGNYVYGFPTFDMKEGVLVNCVQENIDSAVEDGADIVVAVGHMGIEGSKEGWKSTDIIAGTSGIDVFLDAHSHEVIKGDTYKNKYGENVLLSSTGTKFAYFGQLTINADGTFETKLIDPDDIDVNSMSEAAKAEYNEVKEIIDGYNAQIEHLYGKIGTSEVNLIVEDENGNRLVRKAETNMGNFVADAYLNTVEGAEIALVNGGGIRAGIDAGSVSRMNLLNANPFGNEMCIIKATGQQIVDALEHGARSYPEAIGGFLQVSSTLSYEIEAWKKSPVVTDSDGSFLRIDSSKERRVTNVMYNGEPIDLNKEYTVVGSAYILIEGGDGFTMFKNASYTKTLDVKDSDLLIKYFTENLGGKITAQKYGKAAGRITITEIDPVTLCEHMCHKSGIMGFFWKIVNFFSKIFGSNPVCECGVAHY